MTGARLRIGDDDRDRALRALQEAHAAGRLDHVELGDRQDEVLAARHQDELDAVLADLPEGRALARQSAGHVPNHVPTPTDVPPTSAIAVLSGKTIMLEPGSPGLRAFAFWGGHDVYLRDCMGPGTVVVLNVSAIMGGHDIYVPPGVRVIDQTVAIMAGNDIDLAAQGDGSNGTLILKGFLFWAGSDVHIDPAAVQRHVSGY